MTTAVYAINRMNMTFLTIDLMLTFTSTSPSLTPKTIYYYLYVPVHCFHS
ncbi:hypothetical protein DJ91_5657 [Priestia megaterium]|nr:hypothetical protein DJ91_5657 [Priestia megaterium]